MDHRLDLELILCLLPLRRLRSSLNIKSMKISQRESRRKLINFWLIIKSHIKWEKISQDQSNFSQRQIYQKPSCRRSLLSQTLLLPHRSKQQLGQSLFREETSLVSHRQVVERLWALSPLQSFMSYLSQDLW